MKKYLIIAAISAAVLYAYTNNVFGIQKVLGPKS